MMLLEMVCPTPEVTAIPVEVFAVVTALETVLNTLLPVIVQAELPVATLIPLNTDPALNTSKILLFSTLLPLLSIAGLVPVERIPFMGRLAPAGPIVFSLKILLSFPVALPPANKTTPVVAEPDPCIVQ